MSLRTAIAGPAQAPQQALDYTVNPELSQISGPAPGTSLSDQAIPDDGGPSPSAALRTQNSRGNAVAQQKTGLATTLESALPDWVAEFMAGAANAGESGVAAGPPPTAETGGQTLADGSLAQLPSLSGLTESLGAAWDNVFGEDTQTAGTAATTEECIDEEAVGVEECPTEDEVDEEGFDDPECVDVNGVAYDPTAALKADATAKDPYVYPDQDKYETEKGAGYHYAIPGRESMSAEELAREIEKCQQAESLGMYMDDYTLNLKELADYLMAWNPPETRDEAAWLLKAIEGRFVKCANGQIVKDLEDIMNEVIIAIQVGDSNHKKYGEDPRYRHDPAAEDYDIPILEFLVAFVRDLMQKWLDAGAKKDNWLITLNSLMRWGSTSSHGSGDKKISSKKGELRTGSNHGQGEAVDLAFPEGNKAEAQRILQAAIDCGYAGNCEVGVPSDNTVFFRDSDEWEAQRAAAEGQRQKIIDDTTTANEKAAEEAKKAGKEAPEPVDPLTKLAAITVVFVGMHQSGRLRQNTLNPDGTWKVKGHKGEKDDGKIGDKIIDADILKLLVRFGAYYLDYRGHIHTTYRGGGGTEETDGASGDAKQDGGDKGGSEGSDEE